MTLCYTVKGFNGESVLIPGCMHAAVYNVEKVSGCVCRVDKAAEKDEHEESFKLRLERAIDVLGKRSVEKVVAQVLAPSPSTEEPKGDGS